MALHYRLDGQVSLLEFKEVLGTFIVGARQRLPSFQGYLSSELP